MAYTVPGMWDADVVRATIETGRSHTILETERDQKQPTPNSENNQSDQDQPEKGSR